MALPNANHTDFTGTQDQAEEIGIYFENILTDWLINYCDVTDDFRTDYGCDGLGFPFAFAVVQDYVISLELTWDYDFEVSVRDTDDKTFKADFADVTTDNYSEYLDLDLLDRTIDYLVENKNLYLDLEATEEEEED